MPSNIITVLNSAVAENGPTQTVQVNFLKKMMPLRFSIALGAGDTVVIEGKAETADDFEILHTFTDETPADVYVSRIWRARRSVDGTSADSVVKVENSYNLDLTAHA
jgi:hypothetical protein